MSGYDVVRTGTFGTTVAGVSLGRGVARSDDSEKQAKEDVAKIQSSAENVFGNVRINMAASNIGGLYKGNGPHATTGIPYAVSGQADVVSVDVTERLAAFSDPIKALLGTGVHESNTVIIKRQYVSGGGADIVPERAPARTVRFRGFLTAMICVCVLRKTPLLACAHVGGNANLTAAVCCIFWDF